MGGEHEHRIEGTEAQISGKPSRMCVKKDPVEWPELETPSKQGTFGGARVFAAFQLHKEPHKLPTVGLYLFIHATCHLDPECVHSLIRLCMYSFIEPHFHHSLCEPFQDFPSSVQSGSAAAASTPPSGFTCCCLIGPTPSSPERKLSFLSPLLDRN